ncbi:MAG TPA: VanZ family protein [Gemmatimonadaceae bacterium]|nr:VanZ family protein [Gemmatimonadaceae bacterium]
MALIARLTLKPLGGPLPSGFNWCVFCGSFGAADFLLNIALFVPLGWGLRTAGLRRWPIYLFGFLLAGTIETLQDFVISGRESGLNDIIANPLGGIVGVWLADHMRLILSPDPKTSRRLALGAAVAWLVLTAVIPWLMGPSLPRTQYWEQVAADLPKFGKYRGQILSATYDDQPFRSGRLSDSASAAMRSDFLHGRARVDITTIPAPNAGGHLAPIVGVFDGERQEIFMVACAGQDLVFGVRTRLDDLRFHSPAHRLHGVIPCDSTTAPGDTIRIAAAVDRVGLLLAVARAGKTASARPDAGAWQGWRLLLSDQYGKYARYGPYLTVLWTVLWLFPLGYWLGRSPGRWFALGVGGLTLIVSLAIIPMGVGSRPAPPHVWIAGAIGLLLGFLWTKTRLSLDWMSS